jgi:hypothetical protein
MGFPVRPPDFIGKPVEDMPARAAHPRRKSLRAPAQGLSMPIHGITFWRLEMKKKSKAPVSPIHAVERKGFFKTRLVEIREEATESISLGICIALTAGFTLVVDLLADEAGAAHGLFNFTAAVLVGAIVGMLLTQKSAHAGKELVGAYHRVRKVRDPAERAKMDVKVPSTAAFLNFAIGAVAALASLAISAWLSGWVMEEVELHLSGSVLYALLDFLHRNLMVLGLALFLINRVDFLADWLVAVNKVEIAETAKTC